MRNKEDKTEYNIEEEKLKEDNIKNDDNIEIEPEENPNCIYDIDNVEIFQTLDENQGLATYNRGDKYSYKTALFELPYSFLDNIKLYDGLRIKVPEGQCFIISDIYRYETKGGDNKVVPIITFTYKYKPKNKEEFIERIEKEANGVKQKFCSFNSKEEIKKQGFKSVKQCECYAETMFDVDNLIKLENLEKYSEKKKIDELDELIKQVEKKCGKLLNTKQKKSKNKKL